MRLDLVPERHRGHQVIALDESADASIRELLRPLVLDFHPQRFLERHRVGEVKPINRPAVPGRIALPQRHAVKRAVMRAKPPAVAEVILRAGAPQARFGFAVNKEEIIPLPVPPGGHILHALHGAHVMPPPLEIGQQVVAPHHARMLLPVHRVEISRVPRQRLVLLPVQVIVKRVAPPVAFIGDRNARRLAERHRPITVPPAAIRRHLDRQRHKGFIQPVADAEEIANRALDARVLLAVPIHPQRQQPRVERRRMGDGVPKMRDHARPFQVGQHQRPPRLDRPRIRIPVMPVRVRGRFAHGLEVFELFQPRHRAAE